MTYSEILKDYNIVKTAIPKKGELFIAVTNRGADYTVQKATNNMKFVVCNIVQKKG